MAIPKASEVGKEILSRGKKVLERLRKQGKKILSTKIGKFRKGQITIEGIFLAIFGFIILANMLPVLDNYIVQAAENADPMTAMFLSWIKPVLVISFLASIWGYSRIRIWGYK